MGFLSSLAPRFLAIPTEVPNLVLELVELGLAIFR